MVSRRVIQSSALPLNVYGDSNKSVWWHDIIEGSQFDTDTENDTDDSASDDGPWSEKVCKFRICILGSQEQCYKYMAVNELAKVLEAKMPKVTERPRKQPILLNWQLVVTGTSILQFE